jgi:hypothetical protein
LPLYLGERIYPLSLKSENQGLITTVLVAILVTVALVCSVVAAVITPGFFTLIFVLAVSVAITGTTTTAFFCVLRGGIFGIVIVLVVTPSQSRMFISITSVSIPVAIGPSVVKAVVAISPTVTRIIAIIVL